MLLTVSILRCYIVLDEEERNQGYADQLDEIGNQSRRPFLPSASRLCSLPSPAGCPSQLPSLAGSRNYVALWV
jgi:hypothetical protein